MYNLQVSLVIAWCARQRSARSYAANRCSPLSQVLADRQQDDAFSQLDGDKGISNKTGFKTKLVPRTFETKAATETLHTPGVTYAFGFMRTVQSPLIKVRHARRKCAGFPFNRCSSFGVLPLVL